VKKKQKGPLFVDRDFIEKATFNYGIYNLDFKLSTNQVIKICKEKFDIKLNEKEIQRLCFEKLVEFKAKKKKNYFPPYTPARINFIKGLSAKYSYSVSRLQQIVKCQNLIFSVTPISFLKVSDIKGNITALKKISAIKPYDIIFSRIKESSEANDKTGNQGLKEIEEIIGKMKYVKEEHFRKEWLSTLNEKSIILYPDEMFDGEIGLFNSRILEGYSPQIRWRHKFINKKKTIQEIDWKKTFEIVELYDFVSYFRTPEYLVELNKDVVNIKILNCHRVTSSEFRTIEKLFTIFRERISSFKLPWGVKSGKKSDLTQRNKNIKKVILNYLATTPKATKEKAYDEAKKYVEKMYSKDLSLESIRKIDLSIKA